MKLSIQTNKFGCKMFHRLKQKMCHGMYVGSPELYKKDSENNEASKQAKTNTYSKGCRRGTLGSPRRSKATYVNELNIASLLEVMQDRSIIKVCQAGHVLAFRILGGLT